MTSKITVRMGGGTADPTVDYTSVARFFEPGGTTRYISGGGMWDNGGASQGEALIDDDAGEIPRADDTRNLAGHNLILWTEDAPGCEYLLAWGRRNTAEVSRGDKPWGNAQQIHFTWDDPNWELRGLPIDPDVYPTGWSRPAETDVERAKAVITTFCQRVPRYTTNISTDLIVDANTVLMPAKVYPPGTELGEILADCATAAGKGFGVVINPTTAPANLSLVETLTWDGGTSTYQASAANVTDATNHTGTQGWYGVAGPATGDAPGTGTEGTTYFNRVQLDNGYPGSTFKYSASAGDHIRVTGWIFPYWNEFSGTYGQLVVQWYASDGMGGFTAIGYEGIGELIIGNSGVNGPWQQFDGTTGAAPATTVGYSLVVVPCTSAGIAYTLGVHGVGRTYWRDQWRIYGPASTAGACWHLSLLYTIPTDYTTFASTVKISVDPADNNPSGSPPVFYPIHDQGAAWIGDGADLPASKVISSWANGTATSFVTADAGTAIVNSYDYYAVAVNDSLSVTSGQAAARATAVLNSMNTEHISGQLTIKVDASQVNLLSAGMPIQVKEFGMGQYLGTYQNRRIASLKWEPAAPEVGSVKGKYYAHMQLDRPQRVVPGALPGSTGVSQGGAGSGSSAAIAAAQAAAAAAAALAASDNRVPYYIPVGETYTVALNKQALWTIPIVVDGAIVVDGVLVGVD